MNRRDAFAFVSFAVLLTAASAANAASVRICHFAGGGAKLLTVSENALPAHRAHGDVPAPSSVRTDADCLVPQPPPAPVAQTGTSDAQGVASFLIPETNVIARIVVRDEDGAPVSGAKTQILVAGNDYLVTSVDPGRRLAPAFAEGRISDARPGSAPQLVVQLVMKIFSATFPAGKLLQTAGNLPAFVRAHFTTDVRCFTRDEYAAFVANACENAHGLVKDFLFEIILPAGAVSTAVGFLWDIPISDACAPIAAQDANRAYAGQPLPLQMRVYHPPLLPGVTLYPMFFEQLGNCGGACCVAQGPQCELASDVQKCAGTYKPGVSCNAHPCRRGACCDPNGTCRVETPEDCAARSGTYQGDGTPCSPNPCPQTLRFILQSSRNLGPAGQTIPVTGGTIRVKVLVPGNMIRGSGTTGDCGRGDARVDLRVCPQGAGCTGVTIQAGQGQGLNICHQFDETLGPFSFVNPSVPSSFSFNAVTEKISTAEVEITP